MFPKIKTYCLNWHLDFSTSLQYLCGEPLKPYLEIIPIGWNEDTVLEPMDILNDRSEPVIFFQLPPPPNILEIPGIRLIWVPMWDQAHGYSQEWWNNLPKSLRIVAFSKKILERARAAELPTLSLLYFMNPNDILPSPWNSQRVLFYWNRTGLINLEFLRRFCLALNIDLCFFRDQIDPIIEPSAAFQVPNRLGKTEIRCFKQTHFQTRNDHLRILRQANVFIAPRAREGVGLSLLEAMAQGCAVFSYDAPAMNEYINHLQNGYLLPPYYPSVTNHKGMKLHRLVRRFSPLRFFKRSLFERPITQFQNWKEISRIDLEGLGKAARQGHFEGHVEWQKSIPEYGRFILDW